MRHLRTLFPAAMLLATSAWPIASLAGSTTDELAGARKRMDESRLALDAANASLAGLQTKLDTAKGELDKAYRALASEMENRDREAETASRAQIKTLSATRDRLTADRDRAKTFAALQQARFDTEEALLRLQELQVAAQVDPSQVQFWQKKHDKALAMTRRLERRLAEP